MRLPDERGPLEHLYSLHIPNCDKHGLYNLKQVSRETQSSKAGCMPSRSPLLNMGSHAAQGWADVTLVRPGCICSHRLASGDETHICACLCGVQKWSICLVQSLFFPASGACLSMSALVCFEPSLVLAGPCYRGKAERG